MVSARADATPISKSAVMSVAEIASQVAAVMEMRIIYRLSATRLRYSFTYSHRSGC